MVATTVMSSIILAVAVLGFIGFVKDELKRSTNLSQD
jgi:hypothetical protein